MQLIFDEYFKMYPVKKKIVEALYKNGISIVNDKFFLNNIEIPLSSIANAINVNRRTLYETIKFINRNNIVKKIMENISVLTDDSKVSLMMGDEVITIYINIGSFSKVLWEFMSITKKYSSYIKEIYSINSDRESNFIRVIFYNKINEEIFKELDIIPGINKIVINSPEKINIICNKCEVKICEHKLSSEIRGNTI